MTDTATTIEPPPRDDERVPVDERVLGFDRRSILPGVIALVMWFTWAHVLPWIDEQIEFDNPVVAGDVIDLGNGELTLTPAVGWNRESGVLVSEQLSTGEFVVWPSSAGTGADALLTQPEIGFEVNARLWDGTPQELLDRLLDIDDALDDVAFEDVQDTVEIANVDGVPGLLAPYSTFEQDGFVAVYVFEVEVAGATDDAEPTTLSVGIEASASAPIEADVSDEEAQEIIDMLTSITYRPGASEEGADS